MMLLKERMQMCAYRLLITAIIVALFSFASFAQQETTAKKSAAGLTANEQKAASRLRSQTIREVTTILASKGMEGRGTAQPGADRAAKYIAERFAKLGLKPGGDANTYLQTIKFIVERVSPESSFKASDTSFKYKEDFLVFPPFPTEPKDIRGNLIFVGYGVISEKLKRNDLKDVDVKGKVVMVLGGKPKNVDNQIWAKEASQEAVFGRLILKGAAGFVIVWEDRQNLSFSLLAEHLRRRQTRLAQAPSMLFKIPPIIIVNERMAEKLFTGQSITFPQARRMAETGNWVSRDLNNPITLSIRVKREEGTSSNVIAVLEGSDPKLRDQAVIITAHYDAYGIDEDGTIYPGAADNALGVGKLIAIAESMKEAKLQLRRSIIFIALTGEEYGSLGAEHWVSHPTWPIEKVAANINYDSIGTEAWGPLGTIIDVGYNHSDLEVIINDVAASYGISILPDPMPEQELLSRSDHYTFFKRGIPALFLIGGPKIDNLTELLKRANSWLTTRYHMSTDTVQLDWDWEGVRTLSKLGLITCLRIANQEAMPAWKPDSPYNRPRGTNLPPPEKQ